MKDELPDLTPYLNKKGGNSQGRGEEPAGKTDISQKLSALVKKPGTSTGTHTSVAAAADAAQAHADQASVADKSTTGDMEQPGSNGAGQAQSVSSWDDAADESPIGIVLPPAPAPAPAPAPTPVEDSSARWGAIARSGNPELFSTSTESQNAPSPAPAEAPPAVAEGYPGSSSSPSREMARPGPAVPLGQDKLKGPQAKPMSTLSSSSAPPLLKQPPKTPGRPAQPYSYKPVIEPGREAMAPKAPSSAPVNRAPQPVATPKPAQPVPPSSSVQSGPVQSAPVPSAPAPSAPAPSNASPPSQAGSSAPPGPASSSSSYSSSPSSSSSPYSSAPASPPSAPAPVSRPRVETDAEKLARAFMEEAKALQNAAPADSQAPTDNDFGYDDAPSFAPAPASAPAPAAAAPEPELSLKDYLDANIPAARTEVPAEPEVAKAVPVVEPEPEAPAAPSRSSADAGPRSSLSSLFDSGVLNSRYEVEPPKKALGFGNLLAGSGPSEEENKHTTFSDLMVPTGEHDALFAPDRRDAEQSAFDEVQEQVDSSSMRVSDKAEPPAFSSLFSNEIVTSGTDFSSPGRESISDWSAEAAVAESQSQDSDLLEPASSEAEAETPVVSPKSLAISKLIEAVNQSETIESSDVTESDTVLRFEEPVPPVSEPQPPAAEQITPDLGGLSPSAMEALAAFVPKAGEEQHETKGLLAKLKAKDAAAKAAMKADGAKAEGGKKEEAKKEEPKKDDGDQLSSILSQIDSADVQSQPTPAASSSLASLLGGAKADEKVETASPEPAAAAKPEVKAQPKPAAEPADDEDSGNSLGDAISDALDKLLGEAGEADNATSVSGLFSADDTAPGAGDSAVPDTAAHSSGDFASMSSGLSKLLDDDPDRFNRPINATMQDAEEVLEAAITSAAEVEPVKPEPAAPESHPLTLTNSKVDALSRLLEVASKAPEKSAEEKARAAAEAAAGGRSSRQQVESMDAPDSGNQPKKEAFTSPFGGSAGTSPFGTPINPYADGQPGSSSGSGMPGMGGPATSGSPFGTAVNSSNSGVSMTHTPAGSFSPTGQSAGTTGFTGTGSMTDMPKASGIASDAVSARIAALNRKLEEQTKAPGSSGTVNAMPPNPQQNLAPQPDFQAPPPMQAPPPSEFTPNPIVDDSPQTRAELVNRILGSAKISQTSLPDLPSRSAQELPMDQALAQVAAQKGQKSPPKSKARARGHRSGPDPRTILLVVAVLVIAGLGGYVALQNGVFKGFDFAKIKPTESKATVEQLIKSGDLDKAVEVLEAKKESGKFTASESEKLNGLYYQLADKASDDDPAEAVKLLEKIPSKSKKYKDAQKLLRKLKKKVRKN